MRRASILNEAVAMVLVFMLLVKAFVPQGYMPDMAALQDGIFKMTICTASGLEKKLLSDLTSTPPAKTRHAGPDFCPFGWSPHAMATTLSLFLLPEIFSVPEVFLAFQELFLSKPRHTLASPRAPPAIH